VYLRILSEQFDIDVTKISSEELAELAGVNAAKVRKDLSYLGSYGTRGVGYEVEFLVYQIRRELGLTHNWPVVIVGAGNMGQALAGYNGFGDRGFTVGGIVDIDDAKVGRDAHERRSRCGTTPEQRHGNEGAHETQISASDNHFTMLREPTQRIEVALVQDFGTGPSVATQLQCEVTTQANGTARPVVSHFGPPP